MEEKENIVRNIRACLVSRKGKCTLGQLMGDYKTLIGGNIPYARFNFRNLEDFLRSVDSLALINMSGQIYVEARLDEKSKHVAALIEKQKPAKKKSRELPTHYIKRYANPALQNRWRPKNITNKWRTSYEGTRRPDQVDHRQYVKVTSENKPAPTVHHQQYPQTTYRNDRPLAPVSNNIPTSVVSNGSAEKPDLRAYLNAKKPHEGAPPGGPGAQHPEKVPHSERTNRAVLMQGIVKRNTTANLMSTQMQNLRNASMEAVDMQSPVWDSWTSSSDEENRSVRRRNQQFQFTGDMIVDLYNFARYHKLSEPNFKVVQRSTKQRKQMMMFDCKLTVGEHTYRSYPKDFFDEKTVKEYVAAVALADLKPKYTKRQSMLISNDQDVLNRIPELVEKHYHGIWKWQLEADYTDIYKEVLPLNWLEIVDRSQSISVEPFLDQYVLRCCNPEDILQKGKRLPGGPASEVSVPTNTVHFREDGTLMAEITSIVSAKEVWCRQIGTPESESFDIMINEFAEVYKELKDRNALRKPANLTQGGYYVALAENFWHRVRVFEVGENDVNCFFIDYGDEEWIKKEDIYQLEREFAKHQAQAFICCLAGLEELYEVSINSIHLHQLVGREVQLETDIVEQVSHSPNTLISAVLYDTDNNNNVSLNQTLISQITIDSATPALNKNTVTEAFVSHTEDNGDIYVTIQSPGYDKLLTLLAELKESIAKDPPKFPREKLTPESAQGRLFLARYKKHGDEDPEWQRVRINDWAPSKLYAQLYFVDIGDCSIVTLSAETIYPLDQLSDVLNQFPAQAVKVRMLVDRIPSDFVEKVNELMPTGMPVLLKFIEENNEKVPVVNFFKRIGPSNDLCSINESISFDEEQKTSHRPEKLQRLISLSKIDDAKNMPSTGILNTPHLPDIGVYFDVKVPFAVNPWNFFVQPYESNVKLDALMDEMQKRYGNVTFSPLQVDDIVPGRIYASKHDDGKWYRTSVMKVIHSGSISVFYCDFGYYANLTLQQLIPLDPKFLTLEYQAIKAKLHGIAPKQSKWTMEDCKYFQKLVCRKSLVSILVSVDKDELYRGDSILNLKLIDTSTDVDVNIDDVLVRKGIAKRVTQTNGQ